MVLEFGVLGRIEARRGGQRIDLGRRRERCLLGVLLLQPGSVVPVDRLLDLLWDGDPPASARATLHTHVARLRACLEQVGAASAPKRGPRHRASAWRSSVTRSAGPSTARARSTSARNRCASTRCGSTSTT